MPQTLKQEFTDEIQEKTDKADKNIQIAKKLSLKVETGILEIVTDYEIQLEKNDQEIKRLKEENKQIIEKKDKEIVGQKADAKKQSILPGASAPPAQQTRSRGRKKGWAMPFFLIRAFWK